MPAASAVMSTGTSRSFVPRMTICAGEAFALVLHEVQVMADAA